MTVAGKEAVQHSRLCVGVNTAGHTCADTPLFEKDCSIKVAGWQAAEELQREGSNAPDVTTFHPVTQECTSHQL